MCCLFGLLDIKHTLSSKEKNWMMSILGTVCEARGVDATGYSYISNRNLIIKKKAVPAHEMTFNTDIQLKTLSRRVKVFNMKIIMRRDFMIF